MKTLVVCNYAMTWATISERNTIFLSRILGRGPQKLERMMDVSKRRELKESLCSVYEPT